jgi:glucose-1-phosphate thymidylyltransferase
MIAVILCAGFGTRLYPLTKDFPKPLLPVVNRPVLDYLMDQLLPLSGLNAVHIVSNRKFINHYRDWRQSRIECGNSEDMSIELHDDGVTTNADRLGAAADLRLVLKQIARPSRILVSAGDNIYRFPLKPLWEEFVNSNQHYAVALPETDPAKLTRTGVLELGKNDKVLRLWEKPHKPPSTWSCPPLYFLQPSAWQILDEFIEKGANLDAPGHFLDYLCRTEIVSAFKLKSSRLDIGSLESYREADRILGRHPLAL